MLSPPLCGWLGDGLWRGFDAGSDDLAGDGDDPGVCLGQALRAEPRALEGDPHHHDRFLRRSDHGHLRRPLEAESGKIVRGSTSKRRGWIRLTPLLPRPSPANIEALKAEVADT